MTTANYDRRVSSGGAFGYYDAYPTGALPGTDFTASYASGLHNTWIISKDLGAGSTVSVLFGPESANPANAPTPNLFDVGLSFSGSIAVYGVDVGGLSLTSDSLSIVILGTQRNYSAEDLDTLRVDLLDAGVPQETAENFVAVVETAMEAIDTIEAKAYEVFNSINAVDFSGLEDLVSVNLTSGTATSSENGTPVGIGNIAHVTGSAFDDKISGNSTANALFGGAGDDWINGGTGADSLLGGGGDDFIFFDAEDGTNVNGGAGRDVAVALGQAGVTVDLLAQGLEVVVGSAGADTIIMGGNPDILFAAGGDGADTFVIGHSETEATRVIWGGGGADEFVFADGVGGGIAVVTVEGLTAEKFASLTVADLNLGNLNLGVFRAIILNPDATDQFILNGNIFSDADMPGDVEWKGFTSETLSANIAQGQTVYGGYQKDYEFEAQLEVQRDAFENVVSITDYLGSWLADGSEAFDFYEYDPDDQAEQDAAEAFIQSREDEPVFRMTNLETNPNYAPSYGGFFVVGGDFSGASLVATGSLAAAAPDDPGSSPFDWLMVA